MGDIKNRFKTLAL